MEYIEQCLNSLFNQSIDSIEIIVVDDGSKDGTFDYIANMQQSHSNLVLISKANSGYGNSMNIGFNASRGEYIGILESDDYADPNMFKDLYEIAKKNDLDFVKADFNKFYTVNEKEIKELIEICKKNPELYDSILNPSAQPELLDITMNTWSGIYKSE